MSELQEQHHPENLEAAVHVAADPEEAATPEVAPFLIFVGSYYEPRFTVLLWAHNLRSRKCSDQRSLVAVTVEEMLTPPTT